VFHLVSYKWFRKTQLYNHLVEFTRTWELLGGVSDCEELSGGYSQEMM